MKRSHLASLLIVALSGSCLSGCSSTDETERLADMVQQNAVLQEKNTQLSSELTEKNVLTAKLQIKLLEKDAEINRLTSVQQTLDRESVRKKVKKHSPKNKAEAVALLAETETDINTAKELIGNTADQQAFSRLDQLMAEGKAEIEQGNFDKAYSLATEALELAQTMQLKRAVKLKKAPISKFLPSMPMQVSKKSKIRKHPDIHAQILQILEPGTIVTATGYQGHWVKVTVKDQEPGWIYYSLLIVPEI
jgi:hypothetical protein